MKKVFETSLVISIQLIFIGAGLISAWLASVANFYGAFPDQLIYGGAAAILLLGALVSFLKYFVAKSYRKAFRVIGVSAILVGVLVLIYYLISVLGLGTEGQSLI